MVSIHKRRSFRKWYGNNDLLINWENHGKRIKEYNGFASVNESFWFSPCITWGLVTSGIINFRYINDDYHVIGNGGPMTNANKSNLDLIGWLNSSVSQYISQILNPTINLSTGIVSNFPYVFSNVRQPQIRSFSAENIKACKADWDSFETSWDFERHPLV